MMTDTIFRYCPSCGVGSMTAPAGDVFVCRGCGFEFHFNAAAAVCGIITDEQDRLLITIRGRDPAKGLWDLPGGFVDRGESAEQALMREMREELGDIAIESMTYLCSVPNTYPYKNVTYQTADLAFVCRVRDTQGLLAGDDVADVRFVHLGEVAIHKFGFVSIQKIVQHYLSTR